MTALTDAQIISLCRESAAPLLSAPECSNKVVRITDRLVVKFGYFVTAQEFRNQQIAKQRLDADIVNVPTAYRFVQEGGVGYIVMDYVNGDTLNLASARNMAAKLGAVLDHIHQQRGTIPGSLGGGLVSGVLWPEHEEVEFSKTEDLELWLNRPSSNLEHKLDLRCHTLSMCHMDFNPRNIIVDGSRIYVVDWSAAGYFPRFFEHILYQFVPQDLGFFNLMEPFLAPLSEKEREIATTVTKILRYNQIHVL
jgi:aminoglycoside phosphotransferase (APT) family kinase protein